MRYLEKDGTPVTIYQPNERMGGLIWGLRQAGEDIGASRHVIILLFWRDFIAQFRQRILGYFGAIISPLLGIVSFLFLFVVGVLKPGEGEIPYTVYVLVGSTICGCLPGAMGSVSAGLQAQADLILRTRVPKLALAISSLASLAYGIGVSMVTMVIVFLISGITPSPWFLIYPLLVLPMVLLGTAIGLVLSVLGTIARDLTSFASQVLSLVMYITPVIFVRSSIHEPIVQAMIRWNPITYLVDVPRSLICLGHSDNTGVYVAVSAGTLILVVVGLSVF
jgi:lipopolysaccharide transport system permease protein